MNILLIIIILFAVYKVADGWRKGMVKEIISLVSMAVLCATTALIARGAGSYHEGRIFHTIVAVTLLSALMALHHLLKIVFFSAKLISKLPVVHSADKMLGAVFGVLEAMLLLWTLYIFIMLMDLGVVEEILLSCIEEDSALKWMYENNYLAYFTEKLLARAGFMPFG